MFDLLLLDDDPDSRLLVSIALKLGETFDLVAETGSVEEALTLVESIRPDVAVIDPVLDDADVFSAISRLREIAPDAKVVLRSAFAPAELRFVAATGGASGYLEKSRSPLTLGDDLLAVCGLLDVVEIGIGTAKAHLGTDHRSPRLARRFVTRAFERWDVRSELDVIELLVSELVTNSIVHGRSDVEISVAVAEEHVRVTVFDASREPLVRREPGTEAASGRGLLMLDALATAWGTEFVPGGKNVWFEVRNEFH
jgi:CheY-like chemotaxis protein